MKQASVVLFICSLACQPLAADTNVTVRVMTRNLDAGTDLNLVLGALDEVSLMQALDATLAEIKDANIPSRAALVADEISTEKPDVVGLQEVTLFRTGPLSLQPAGAQTVLFDQLDLLMSELAKRKLKYVVAVVQNLMDVEAPVPTQNLNLRMTDRDAILVRADLMQSDLDYYNIQTSTVPEPAPASGSRWTHGGEKLGIHAGYPVWQNISVSVHSP